MAPKETLSIQTTMPLSSKERPTPARGAGRRVPRRSFRLGRRSFGLVLLAALWLALMVVASVLSYEYKLPVRIENWKPSAP